MAQVRLLSITTVLTVLIWASADSLVSEELAVRVVFEPTPAARTSTMLVELVEPDAPYELVISGSRSVVEDMKAQAPLHVRFQVPEYPTQQIDLQLDRSTLKQQMSEQWREFRKLTILSIQPDALPLTVDHWMTRDVDLVMKRLTLAYDVEPQLQRSSVAVRMRESDYLRLPAGERLQIDVTAEVERLLKDQSAGQSVTIPLTLDSGPFGRDAQLIPGAVTVTATVKAQHTTASIPTVPILIAMSFANLERSIRPVARDGTPLSLVTQTITVTGPTDEVGRLVSGAARAYGIIHIKQDDFESLDELKLVTPEYRLPPGVELAGDPPSIEFKLINAIKTEINPG